MKLSENYTLPIIWVEPIENGADSIKIFTKVITGVNVSVYHE